MIPRPVETTARLVDRLILAGATEARLVPKASAVLRTGIAALRRITVEQDVSLSLANAQEAQSIKGPIFLGTLTSAILH